MKIGGAITFILVIVLTYFIFHKLYEYAIGSPYVISAEDAKSRIKRGQVDLILDVRTKFERDTLGFYPGSVHIQSADLDVMMPKRYPDKSIRILAYCNTGQRARMATEKLHKLGYKNAVYIATHYQTLQ
jgi:hypothetical protein